MKASLPAARRTLHPHSNSRTPAKRWTKIAVPDETPAAGIERGSPRGVRIGRAPFLLLGMLSLLMGLWGGLARLGLQIGPVPAEAIALHGPLMLAGFLGTLLGLERAVATRKPWAYSAPLFTGIGSLLLIATAGGAFARSLVALGSVAMAASLLQSLLRLRARWNATQLLGALSFATGSVLFATGEPFPHVLPWWQAFLVLTIVGERLELSRLLEPTTSALWLFGGIAGLLLLGAVLQSAGWYAAGVRLSGISWLGLALWLARWDLARKSFRRPALSRYVATAVLVGHAWLAAAGALAIGFAGVGAGLGYDATLHALLLGFVFSMIFGHAPLIFPTVLGLPIVYRPRFWVHLGLLHAGVLLRVTSDLFTWSEGRLWGGSLNAVAILLFLIQTVSSLGRKAEASG